MLLMNWRMDNMNLIKKLLNFFKKKKPVVVNLDRDPVEIVKAKEGDVFFRPQGDQGCYNDTVSAAEGEIFLGGHDNKWTMTEEGWKKGWKEIKYD